MTSNIPTSSKIDSQFSTSTITTMSHPTTLLKQKSFLASTPLYEIVSEKIIKGLLTLDSIDANQKQQLTQYLSKWNPKTGMVKVNYIKTAKH